MTLMISLRCLSTRLARRWAALHEPVQRTCRRRAGFSSAGGPLQHV